jgi:hypothetical protein
MSDLEKCGWKYGLIKVSIEDEGTEFEEQINHLVELYPGENGNYTSFCNARLITVEELEFALNDIKTDGINEYFFDNGKFNWDICESCYTSDLDWEPANKKIGTASIKENKSGDPYLELTADILCQMGWAQGDDIEFDCNENGTFMLTKINQKMIIQTISGKDIDDDADLYAVYGGD